MDDEYIGDDFIAHTSLPVGSLRQGYRSLPLYSAEGKKIPNGWLVVRIGISSCPLQLELFNNSTPVQSRRAGYSGRVALGSGQPQMAGRLKLVGVREPDELIRAASNVLNDARSVHERATSSFQNARTLLGLHRDASMIRCITVLMAHDAQVSLVTRSPGQGEWMGLNFEPSASLPSTSSTSSATTSQSTAPATEAVRRLITAFKLLIDDLDTAVRLSPDIARRLNNDAKQLLVVANNLPAESPTVETLVHNVAIISAEACITEQLAKNCQEMLKNAVSHARHVASQ